jgi:hypothetical protein
MEPPPAIEVGIASRQPSGQVLVCDIEGRNSVNEARELAEAIGGGEDGPLKAPLAIELWIAP